MEPARKTALDAHGDSHESLTPQGPAPGDATDRQPEACRWIEFRTLQGASAGVFDVVLKATA